MQKHREASILEGQVFEFPFQKWTMCPSGSLLIPGDEPSMPDIRDSSKMTAAN